MTLLAAGFFGLVLLVSPRLTYSSSDPAPVPSTTLSTAPDAGGAATTSTTAPTATTTTVPPIWGGEGWDPAAMTPENGYDGTIALTAQVAHPEGVSDGDWVVWELEITSSHEGRLWGTYAWVEGYGRARCDSHVISAGGSVTCWAEGPAYAGEYEIVAWANAWTSSRQVKAKVLVPLSVGA